MTENIQLPLTGDLRIAVIGLGYVGLPLAVGLSRHFDVIGFDVNPVRIKELQSGLDRTAEVSDEELSAALGRIRFSEQRAALKSANFFIVTVPTPIDNRNRPDLRPLILASKMIGEVMQPGSVVVFESTVYPGATEDDCVPVLASISGLNLNSDFWVGYSPERINPGDQVHRLETINKIVSGSTPEATDLIESVYSEVVNQDGASTFKASSIKVAEAAKVIENTQRDINIALVNELAKIFGRLDISTRDVLEAARTKWNFLDFRPGLVGGHCIGVDPYYLAEKAIEVGYNPELILGSRRINDGMGAFVAQQAIKLFYARRGPSAQGDALVLGLTFKENCPDTRNSKVVDIIDELLAYSFSVDVYDPWVSSRQTEHLTQEAQVLSFEEISKAKPYGLIILAVGHNSFKETETREMIMRNREGGAIVFDVKNFLDDDMTDGSL